MPIDVSNDSNGMPCGPVAPAMITRVILASEMTGTEHYEVVLVPLVLCVDRRDEAAVDRTR